MKFFYIIFIFLYASTSFYAQSFYKGADLSYLNEMEDCGALYYENNIEKDAYEIFLDHGANIIRYRLWHTPDWTEYSTLPDVKIAISRAKAIGFKVLLDFHYSDTWADPGHQLRPSAWNGITDTDILADSVFEYTYSVLYELNNEGLMPEYVQIGNETNPNILLEEGDDLWPLNWNRNVQLFQAGIQAVHEVNNISSIDAKTIIHIADHNNLDWWFSEASQNGLTNFDIIGVSYYSGWHDGDIANVGQTIGNIIQKFSKDVIIVETGYPWTLSYNDNANNIMNANFLMDGYPNPPTPEGQRDFLIDLTSAVINNGGLGVIYWEPAWVSTTCYTLWGQGSHYENATFFDFENNLHEGIEFLNYDYSSTNLLSIDEFNITLFPNLVNNSLKVESSIEISHINILNIFGVQVKEIAISKQKTIILDIAHIPAGIYYCKVFCSNKYKAASKIFIKY